MNRHTQMDKSIKDHRKPARLAFLAALLLTTTISVAQLAVAADQNEQVQPQLALAALKGRWAATLVGNTGCGLTSMFVTFRLNSAGHVTARPPLCRTASAAILLPAALTSTSIP
jgi:hypothetical protein